ncbi:MAG: transposase [Phycisphaerae bacterium]
MAARIRNETQAMQEVILARCDGLRNGHSVEFEHEHGRLIVAYSDQRARKDAYNRQRGLRRLRKRISSGRLSKEHLNNRGYNRFLTLTGEVTVELDEAKVAQAARWDGLKGYLTNTKLSPDAVIENYGQLWQIERAFRISKTDLRIRPMYHYRRRRIEAHVLVAFVAYTIYKELERRLGQAGMTMSPKRAAELTQTMYEMTFRLPNDPQDYRKLLQMDPEQQALYDLLY